MEQKGGRQGLVEGRGQCPVSFSGEQSSQTARPWRHHRAKGHAPSCTCPGPNGPFCQASVATGLRTGSASLLSRGAEAERQACGGPGPWSQWGADRPRLLLTPSSQQEPEGRDTGQNWEGGPAAGQQHSHRIGRSLLPRGIVGWPAAGSPWSGVRIAPALSAPLPQLSPPQRRPPARPWERASLTGASPSALGK